MHPAQPCSLTQGTSALAHRCPSSFNVCRLIIISSTSYAIRSRLRHNAAIHPHPSLFVLPCLSLSASLSGWNSSSKIALFFHASSPRVMPTETQLRSITWLKRDSFDVGERLMQRASEPCPDYGRYVFVPTVLTDRRFSAFVLAFRSELC